MDARTPRRGARIGLLVAALVLGAGGATAVGVGLAGQEPAPPNAGDLGSSGPQTSAPSSSASPGSSPTSKSTSESSGKSTSKPTSHPKPSGPVELPESVPTRMRIPSIGVNASFVDLDLLDNGELATPADPDQVGWFTGAHTPGSPGISVVAGHVTWNRRPTVFFKLGDLRKGDHITVVRKDGSKATFAVQRRSTFPKDAFPTDEVYRDSAVPELTLITCGGRYDYSTHSYGSNVIVWASLVSTHPA